MDLISFKPRQLTFSFLHSVKNQNVKVLICGGSWY